MPLLQRYALARPNARSSHTTPTPQGGGIAVIVATLCGALSPALLGYAEFTISLATVSAATILLACVGTADDLHPLPVLPRLILQGLAAAAVIATLPGEIHIFQWMPVWAERTLLLIAALWFINLVNFMDGLDWITVAEIVPITICLALFGLSGELPNDATIAAIALAGAMVGFAPFNRPIAKLFLGDVGSLPVGLLTGWMLFELAGRGHLIAALLLPLYYLTDATATLFRRALNGERVWDAHRSHFYQRATSNGLSVMQIVSNVFMLNIALAAMATLSIALNQQLVDIVLLLLGAGAVALTLWRFSTKQA